jgi:hypothetical protein
LHSNRDSHTTDPLSITASVAGILSLATSSVSELVRFYDAFKAYRSDITAEWKLLNNLQKTIVQLQKSFADSAEYVAEYEASAKVQQGLREIEDDVKQLKILLDKDKNILEGSEKAVASAGQDYRAKIRELSRRMQYRFKQDRMKNLREAANKLSSKLQLLLIHFQT